MKKISNPDVDDFEILSDYEVRIIELFVDDNDFVQGETIIVEFDNVDYETVIDYVFVDNKKAFLGVDLIIDKLVFGDFDE